MQVHQLVLLEYLLFAHDLEGIDLLFASELDQFDPSESAIAQRGQHLEVIPFQLAEDEFAVLLEGGEFTFLHYN